MLDPNVPLATYVGKPKVRVVTPDGKKVIAWGNTLPVTGGSQDIPGKRQEAAVCTAFLKLKLVIDDFMTKEQYNHVMAGNGPPRYNFHDGMYYDYGAYPDGHPSGIRLTSDESLLVAKNPPRPGRPGKRPGKDVGGTEADEDDFEYGTDDKAAQAAVKAEKK